MGGDVVVVSGTDPIYTPPHSCPAPKTQSHSNAVYELEVFYLHEFVTRDENNFLDNNANSDKKRVAFHCRWNSNVQLQCKHQLQVEFQGCLAVIAVNLDNQSINSVRWNYLVNALVLCR